jgi:uncharacterized membrane protein
MLKRIEKYFPIWLNFLPQIIILAVLVYTIAFYNYLPDKIPTHFNFSGQPDKYAELSYINVFLLPFLGLVLCIGMSLINVFLVMLPEDPAAVINISALQARKPRQEKMEKVRTLTARMLGLLNIIIAGTISYLSYASLQVALGIQEGLGRGMWILVLIEMIVTLVLVWRTINLDSL